MSKRTRDGKSKFESVDLGELGVAPPPPVAEPAGPPPPPAYDPNVILQPPPAVPENVVNPEPAPDAAGTENFVPLIPKSLLSLVTVPTPQEAPQALVVQQPQVSQALDHAAREARRLHLSNLPPSITEASLVETMTDWMRTARVKWLQERGVDEDSLGDCNRYNQVDVIVNTYIDHGKASPFAFIEVALADLSDEVIKLDGEITTIDDKGVEWMMRIRRPKDFRVMKGVEKTRVVVTGIPSLLSEVKVKKLMSSEGEPIDFQRKGQYTYCEFATEAEATDTINFLNGMILSKRLVLAHYLTDWMKVAIIKEGITPAKSAENPFMAPEEGEFEVDQLEVVKDLLQVRMSLPQVMKPLGDEYNHLRPVMGTTPVVPTRILVLLNMVATGTEINGDVDELLMDEDFHCLYDSIEEEVTKYGRVEELIIPRYRPAPPKAPPAFVRQEIPKPGSNGGNVDLLPASNPLMEGAEAPEGEGAPEAKSSEEEMAEYEAAVEAEKLREIEHDAAVADYKRKREEFQRDVFHPVHGDRGIGRVFVVYATADEAALAQRMISGRTFNHRTIVTSFLFEDILFPPKEEETEFEADVESEDANVEATTTEVPAESAADLD